MWRGLVHVLVGCLSSPVAGCLSCCGGAGPGGPPLTLTPPPPALQARPWCLAPRLIACRQCSRAAPIVTGWCRRVVKLVRALRKGWLKLDRQQPEKPEAYLIWEDDGGLCGGGWVGGGRG